MGLDFLRRTAKLSSKAWDRGKADLSIPSLFTQQPESQTSVSVHLVALANNYCIKCES